MAATTVSLHLHRRTPHHPPFTNPHSPITAVHLSHLRRTTARFPHLEVRLGLEANNFQFSQNSLQKIRNPVRASTRGGAVMGDYDDDEDEDEEEEDRSLDLLIRFVENVFRKVSKKARKAVRSVLPVPISTKLVGFAVNGTIILTFLWVLKAFLQVICTLGSVVFASILLIRGMWTGISYFQESRGYRADDDEPQSWTGTRPAI